METVFMELLKLYPRCRFEQAVARYGGDRYAKRFTTWQQFITILYSQIKQKDSLRDIEAGLGVQAARWYHLGLASVRRSTLADANNSRDYRIFEEAFYELLERCQKLTPKHKFKFKNPLYSIDSTTINLCLSAFPWARYRKTKGALKMHCLYDHSGALPSFMVVSDGKKSDIRAVQRNAFPLLPDSIISFDRAYIDYKWLWSLKKDKVWFVTRAKSNMDFIITGQHHVTSPGVLWDQEIYLANPQKQKYYPEKLRLVEYFDRKTGRILRFLTNNFKLAAGTIADIYRARWQIELFFKWIKQNLKIKSFLGCSKNAVMTQIWVAMTYYLLLSYIKYQTKYGHSLLYLSRIIRETLFERKSLIDILSLKPGCNRRIARDGPLQLALI